MDTNNCIDTLRQLDQSSPQYLSHLSGALTRMEHDDSIQNLETTDVMVVIEYLDKALGDSYSDNLAFGRLLYQLQKICASRKLLPQSHRLSISDLHTDEHPFTSGGFADVYKATFEGREVCVKKLRVVSSDDREKAAEMFCREAVMWKRLKHPNIVRFIGATIESLQIASEFIPGGDLTSYINSNPEADRMALLLGIANGLDYLHTHHVVHSDLKGPNILVDGSCRALITDFDLAQTAFGKVFKAEGQSARWTAPEVLSGKAVPSASADIFAFAMVVIEVFTGKVPFDRESSVTTMVSIIKGERPPRPPHLTDGLWELVQHCWDDDQRKRPHMWEVLEVLNSISCPQHEGSNCPATKCQPPLSETPDKLLFADGLASPESDPSGRTPKRFAEMYHPCPEEYHPVTREADPVEACQLLERLFSHEILKPRTHRLSEKVWRGFIDALDEALDHLPVTDDLFRKTLQGLQNACSEHKSLPLSCSIPDERFPNKTSSAVGISARRAEFGGKTFCIKTLTLPSTDTGVAAVEGFYREVVVLKRLQHQNLVPFLGVVTKTAESFEVVYDWMENGTIAEYVNRPQTEVDRIGLLRDTADGLYYLHSRGVTHGDLKAANILVNKNGHACLAGYGLTAIRGNNPGAGHQYPNPVAAATWAAPEILQGGVVTDEGDIFAFAVVIFETTTGYSTAADYQVTISDILAGKLPERQQELQRYHGLWELVKRCWDPDPEKRPTALELRDFFRGAENATQNQPPSRSSSWNIARTEESPNAEDKRTRGNKAREVMQKLKPSSKKLAQSVVGSGERLTDGKEHPTRTRNPAIRVLNPAGLGARAGVALKRKFRGNQKRNTE